MTGTTGSAFPACQAATLPSGGFACLPTGAGTPTKPGVSLAEVQGAVAQASSTLRLPASGPTIGPDPAKNEWKMLAVGFPVWAWTGDPTTASQTTTQNGITISFQAIRGATAITWGDGTTTTCTTMTPRPASGIDPMTPSPDCGHVYQRKGSYAVTATSVWTVFWTALGFSGTLYVPRSASTPLEIGELHSVITERH